MKILVMPCYHFSNVVLVAAMSGGHPKRMSAEWRGRVTEIWTVGRVTPNADVRKLCIYLMIFMVLDAVVSQYTLPMGSRQDQPTSLLYHASVLHFAADICSGCRKIWGSPNADKESRCPKSSFLLQTPSIIALLSYHINSIVTLIA